MLFFRAFFFLFWFSHSLKQNIRIVSIFLGLLTLISNIFFKHFINSYVLTCSILKIYINAINKNFKYIVLKNVRLNRYHSFLFFVTKYARYTYVCTFVYTYICYIKHSYIKTYMYAYTFKLHFYIKSFEFYLYYIHSFTVLFLNIKLLKFIYLKCIYMQ